LHVTASQVDVTKVDFVGNRQGGLVVAADGSVTAQTITLSENDRGGLVVAPGGDAKLVDATFQKNEIGINVAGHAAVEKSVVRASKRFGAQVSGTAEFSTLTFEGNPVGLTAIGPAVVRISHETEFTGNATHVEVSAGGKVIGSNSKFTNSTGDCGVHVAGASATFEVCQFLKDSKVAFFSEGSLSLIESRVEGAGEAGFIFGGGSTGTISKSTITKNGKVAAQVQSGEPTIQENEISEHGEFGIYVISGAAPVVEGNDFKRNGLANVWRAYPPR
jgi:parallel beta-helix repeat protein